ncbi:MAG: LysR family transcriptional regulator [Sphingobium sp.]|jgi:DNA-binding transcriptional LysR family regulator|nr:LysR family transcriptional regulator [Sphingomonadaceae bacterium]MCH4151522.1 LysR family transcriptional regulator [Sphingobium sp.]MCI1270696.1 LysR family transcriptional regulator [Sphingobium sp.]MCI1755176.1 LysR family transcriptional regulator [Sphingobium sp.]MCI2053487.1 LysR family transcriptional regulator [Sphingobium sp.]
MQGLDWSDLQIFLAIARAGQLSRAGARLNLDPTTMGRRLRRLETRVGANLFEQTREGQVLTEAGEALLLRVEAMAQSAAQIGEGGKGGSNPVLSGTLRISASEGFGSWFLAKHISDFIDPHPELTFDLVASSGFLSLSKRETDIAVMLSRPKAGPVMARKLADYALRLYATTDYLRRHGTPKRAADLATGHRLIGYIPDLLYAPELRYLDELHPGLSPRLRSSSINAQHHLIASGAGVGVLPCFIGDSDPALRPVLPDQRITRSFWLVTHKDTHQLARIKAGKEWIIEAVRKNRKALLPD